jgi:hypothetical protein
MLLAVALIRLAPAALPDLFAIVVLTATLVVLVTLRIGAFKLMIAGAVLGVVRSHLPAIRGVRAAGRLMIP